MNSRRAGMIAILFIILMLAVWTLARSIPQQSTPLQQDSKDTLTVTHSQVSGEQRYRGLAQLPSPCDSLAAAISVSYGHPPSAVIALTTDRKEGVLCAAEMVGAEFSVSFMSTEVPDISVEMNGKKIPIEVVEQ